MAFLLLGLLIGLLIGMSANGAVAIVIPLLFTFAGGSAIAYFSRQSAEVIRQANRSITALSLGCLVGVFSGIIITENQLLTFNSAAPRRAARESVEATKYLRAGEIERAKAIDALVRTGRLTKEAAYDELKPLLLAPPAEP